MMFKRRAQAVWTISQPAAARLRSKAERFRGSALAPARESAICPAPTNGHPSSTIDTKTICTSEQVEHGFKITNAFRNNVEITVERTLAT